MRNLFPDLLTTFTTVSLGTSFFTFFFALLLVMGVTFTGTLAFLVDLLEAFVREKVAAVLDAWGLTVAPPKREPNFLISYSSRSRRMSL